MIQESISYTFTKDNVTTIGDTFHVDFSWNAVYKVKEKKEWFLIYQTPQIMNMVPKKFFTENQIMELRNTIKSNNIRSRLRKD